MTFTLDSVDATKMLMQCEGSRMMGCFEDRVVVEDKLGEVDGEKEREA